MYELSTEQVDALLRDQQALNKIHDFMNRPGPWNGGDVCEYVAQVLQRTGRKIED